MSKVAHDKSSVRREGAHPSEELHQAMHRNCLICKGRFVSAWTGARICDACRAKSEAASVELVRK